MDRRITEEVMTKLLACDFDGTLFFGEFNRGGQFRQEDVEAIREFQKKGNLVGLNTGRSLKCMDNQYETTRGVLDFDFYSADSGACIADGKKNIFFEKPIPGDEVIRLVEEVEAVFGKQPVFFSVDGRYLTLGFQSPDPANRRIENLEEIRNLKVSGFSFEPDSEQKAAEICQWIKSHDCSVSPQQNFTSVDICANDCSKGIALDILKEHFALKPEDIFAIGDGLNDLPAIENAYVGFAMETGHPGLKGKADACVHSVSQAIRMIEEMQTGKELS